MKIVSKECVFTSVTFVTAVVGGVIYSVVRAKDSFDRMNLTCNSLKNRICEMRNSVNILSDQLKECRTQIFLMNSERGNSMPCKKYTVREHNGIVGVFDDENSLVREVNTAVSSLSAADKQNLLIGIRAKDEKELENILTSLK